MIMKNIFGVQCTYERGQRTKLNKVVTRHNGKFKGVGVICNSENDLQKTQSYHVYKVIVVLHIYNRKLGIKLTGHPANKNKSWPKSNFE